MPNLQEMDSADKTREVNRQTLHRQKHWCNFLLVLCEMPPKTPPERTVRELRFILKVITFVEERLTPARDAKQVSSSSVLLGYYKKLLYADDTQL